MLAERRLAVCADDFGLAPGIGEAVAELAQAGRLTATSCLVNGPLGPREAERLQRLPAEVERGLHFNLTEGTPLSPALRAVWTELPAVPRLLRDALLWRLPLPAIAQEWRAQWDAFVRATGRVPDFVDGHQHVHHLPGVRDIVLAGVAGAPHPVAVRNTAHLPGPDSGVKRAVIALSGGRALERTMRSHGVRHNSVLLGAYDFRRADYRARVQAWLRAVPAQGGLLFCHPARTGEPGDPIGAARVREAAYLRSDGFQDDLRAAGVSLGSTWQRTSSAG